MDFNDITSGLVTEHFDNLSKAVRGLSDTAQAEYAENFGIRIWTVAGPNEDNSFAISMN